MVAPPELMAPPSECSVSVCGEEDKFVKRSQSASSRCLLTRSRHSSCRLSTRSNASQIGDLISSMPGSFNHHYGYRRSVKLRTRRRGTSFIHVTQEAMQKLHNDNGNRITANPFDQMRYIPGTASSLMRSSKHLYGPKPVLRRCKSGVDHTRLRGHLGHSLKGTRKSSLNELLDIAKQNHTSPAEPVESGGGACRRKKKIEGTEMAIVYLEESTPSSAEQVETECCDNSDPVRIVVCNESEVCVEKRPASNCSDYSYLAGNRESTI